jgi:MraZ protein
MSKFRGRFDYSIDEKGRVNIPAKFRKLLAPDAEETFVVCRGPDGCLWAFPQDAWEKFEEKLDAMPLSKETHRIQRLIQDSVTDSKLDKQGRITLSPHQIRDAEIGKEVILLGRRRYIEIWDAKRFDRYRGSAEDFDEVYYAAVRSGASVG